uniref:Palmitoyltransferase n=1 Tax=Callorhinchus milii TaxID=7868 RepID=V9KH67_CALMI
MAWPGNGPECQSHCSHGHHGTHIHQGSHTHQGSPHEQYSKISQPAPSPAIQTDIAFIEDHNNWDIVKATQYGIFDRCKELVEAGYDVRKPDKENVTLLHWAAINNRVELVKYYISKGAIVDQLGGDLNATPLHWATRHGHLSMVVTLMKYGADPSLVDREGFTCLHLAVQFQHMSIIAYIVAKGQDVDALDMNGQTPLILATRKIIGPEPTRFLTKLNASINIADKVQQNTPLHWAVMSGNVAAAVVLLDAGANVEAENAMGETPLTMAHQNRYPWLIQRLTEANLAKSRSHFMMKLFKSFKKYELFLLLLVSVAMIWVTGYIADLDSDSWLLKGILFIFTWTIIHLLSRQFLTLESLVHIPVMFLLGSFFWMLSTWFIQFLPDLPELSVQIAFALSVAGCSYYFYKTFTAGPGYLQSSEEDKKRTVVTLAEAGCLDPRLFCTMCLIQKPLRSKHCVICDCCVARFDHHSIWVGCCVGAGNHRYFVSFLLFLFTTIIWMTYGHMTYWSTHCATTYQQNGLWTLMTEIVSCSAWLVWIFLLVLFHASWLIFMLINQLYQILYLGVTSSERMSLVKHSHAGHSLGIRQNPFNRGCFQNLVDFFQCRCLGLFKPNKIDWTQQYNVGFEQPKANGFEFV